MISQSGMLWWFNGQSICKRVLSIKVEALQILYSSDGGVFCYLCRSHPALESICEDQGGRGTKANRLICDEFSFSNLDKMIFAVRCFPGDGGVGKRKLGAMFWQLSKR